MRTQISQVTLLLSNGMFYNPWVLLWALWHIYNGPHCGMLHGTPPLPHVCARSCAAVVTCGVMETVVSGAMCAGSTDVPLGVYVLIGKSRKMKGSWLRRSSPSVSPIAQRRDCLNLALRRPSWVTPRWPMRNRETGACLVRQSSGRSFGFEKAFLNKRGGNCWCSLFNLLAHYMGAAKLCAGLFHRTGSSRTRSGFTCGASRRVWVTEIKRLMLNIILNTGWVLPYVALRLLFFYIWCSWVVWTSVEVSKRSFHSLTHLFTTSHQF